MKNAELIKIIRELPDDIELDFEGRNTSRIHAEEYIFECDFFAYKDYFGNQFVEVSGGSLYDSGEGKEIPTTDFQSIMIRKLFEGLI